ncbi:MAG: cell envelope integrity protein CreD [Dysgonomonas sp.]
MEIRLGTKVNMIFIKVIVVGILAFIMIIPISMIRSLIMEREENQKNVQDDISEKWGGSQHFTGPILVLPFEVEATSENSKPYMDKIYVLPNDFQVDGELVTEERSRTLFKTLVYQSNLKVSGKLSLPDYIGLEINPEKIHWQDTYVLIGVTFMQGIKNKIEFNVNGVPQKVLPGVKPNSILSSGLTVNTPLDIAVENFDFDFNMVLNGSEGFYINPIGKTNRIQLKSAWNTVSFDGNYLPSERTIDKNGFDARWDVFDYNRNYVQSWTGENAVLQSSSLGVDLKFSIDKYQMTMRSVKYAIMFIVLTFVVFFLVELLSKKRIHPVQYLLVSCALVLFYTLLLAISEHLSFGLSYLIAAFATTALITAYSTTMFKDIKQTTMMAIFLTVLYAYLYIILQQENMALLFGAIGLFVALAIVMFVLRKVDWYKDATDEKCNGRAM